jgi:5'-3' exonuclease
MILVDADIVAFRAAFSAEDETEPFIACSRADFMLKEIAEACNQSSMELWLSGKNNFRYEVFPEYKANRINAKRPKWEHEVKDFMRVHFQANTSEGCEADDMLGVRATELGDGSIIATIDKDLDMIPGWHYNFVKREHYFVSPEKAIRHFYYQCIVGDAADGIKGVPGLGPKKAKNLLDACEEEALRDGTDVNKLYYECVSNLFSCYEEFEMTAKCLWIWRKPGDIWKDMYIGMDGRT